jgi:hypothetical protein
VAADLVALKEWVHQGGFDHVRFRGFHKRRHRGDERLARGAGGAMRDLLRARSYFWAPRVASAVRRRWAVLRNPHCDIRFEGPVYCGPGSACSRRGRDVRRRARRRVRRNFRLELHRGATVRIGGGTVFTYDVLVQCSSTIEIGERCMFGQSSIVVDGNHRFRDSIDPMLEQGTISFRSGSATTRSSRASARSSPTSAGARGSARTRW